MEFQTKNCCKSRPSTFCLVSEGVSSVKGINQWTPPVTFHCRVYKKIFSATYIYSFHAKYFHAFEHNRMNTTTAPLRTQTSRTIFVPTNTIPPCIEQSFRPIPRRHAKSKQASSLSAMMECEEAKTTINFSSADLNLPTKLLKNVGLSQFAKTAAPQEEEVQVTTHNCRDLRSYWQHQSVPTKDIIRNLRRTKRDMFLKLVAEKEEIQPSSSASPITTFANVLNSRLLSLTSSTDTWDSDEWSETSTTVSNDKTTKQSVCVYRAPSRGNNTLTSNDRSNSKRWNIHSSPFQLSKQKFVRLLFQGRMCQVQEILDVLSHVASGTNSWP